MILLTVMIIMTIHHNHLEVKEIMDMIIDENFDHRQALLRSESPTRGLGQFRSGRSSSFAGGILTMLTILGVTEAQLQ